jgi:hypothetical protein
LAGGEAHYGREGRVGELQVSELLHAHVGAHGGGDELDYLHGLLANYMRSEDEAG